MSKYTAEARQTNHHPKTIDILDAQGTKQSLSIAKLQAARVDRLALKRVIFTFLALANLRASMTANAQCPILNLITATPAITEIPGVHKWNKPLTFLIRILD